MIVDSVQIMLDAVEVMIWTNELVAISVMMSVVLIIVVKV